MIRRDSFESIVVLLHEAALNDTHWPTAACLINQGSQMKANALMFGEGHPRTEAEPLFARMFLDGQRREDLEREYLTNSWILRDESVPRIMQLPDSLLEHIGNLYTDREKRTSPVYNVARRDTNGQNGLCVRLDGPVGMHIVWQLGDSTTREGWSSDQLRPIAGLLPHVRQFVLVRQALTDAGALGKSLAELLDNGRCGVLQLNRQGRILEANDRASGLLRHGDGLYDLDGFLWAKDPVDNEELQRLLAQVLTPPGDQSCPGSMTVRRSAARTRLAMHIHPVGERDRDFRPNRVAALALVVDPESRIRVETDIVAAALNLTPSESRLAVMVAAGYSVRTIAASTGRTEGTVRWHLKQIFRKHGISRQADLVRRVLSLDGFSRSPR